MSVILKAENISKQYRLGKVGTGTLSHDINRWWHTVRGKEDPYLKVGDVNDRSVKGISDYVWALKDVNFEVNQGDVLGIIGKNGAGKSTLLKILSRVTTPTTGSIKTAGRIASLLEVGTGFHPELSGRENVFLNGAVLGMTKAEINAKFDEIVDFSGCERYIDTPVKRYSSGMKVRLAFAVAAYLESEILVVDEVLAVGDAEFQKKAIGKMQDVASGEGRTVLFVSHNMAAVRQLCPKSILMKHGTIDFISETDFAIKEYLLQGIDQGCSVYRSFDVSFKKYGFEYIDLIGSRLGVFDFVDPISFNTKLKVEGEDKLVVTYYLRNNFGEVIFFSESTDNQLVVDRHNNRVNILMPSGVLLAGNYYASFGLKTVNGVVLDVQKDILCITIDDSINKRKQRPGNIYLDVKWKF